MDFDPRIILASNWDEGSCFDLNTLICARIKTLRVPQKFVTAR